MTEISEPPSYNETSILNTNKKVLLINHLDRYAIEWFPIYLQLIPKGKDKFGYDKFEKKLMDIYHDLYKGKTNNGYETYKPLPTDFVKRPEIVEARREAWRKNEIKCNAIWIDTRMQHQIDQDSPTIHENYENFLKGVPYYTSCSKPYGKHFFPNIDVLSFHGNKQEYTFKKFDDNNELVDQSNEKLEYLCGKPSYALIDSEVHNAEYEYTLDNDISDIEIVLYNCKKPQKHQSIEGFDINDNVQQNVSDIMNEIFEEDISWSIKKNNDRFTILPEDDIPCIVDRNHTHNNQRKHCIVYASSRCVTATCLSHGSKRFYKKEYPLVEDLKECLGLKLSKDKKNELFQDVQVSEEIEVDDSVLEKMLYNTTTTHECVAKLFKYFFPNDFVCTSDRKNKEWYYFKNGLWESSGDSIIRSKISNEFVNIIKNFCKRAKEKEEDTETSRDLIDYYKNIQDVFKQIIMKCETTGYTDSLIKQLISKYIDKKFIEELDMKKYLLSFGEDVYDLKKNEWRKSTQQDMLSFKCGMNKEDVTDEHKKEMMDIIDSIFPNQERRDYLLNLISRDVLVGDNEQEHFYIWTGSGGNGKGLLSLYLSYCLDDYYEKGDISLITQKRSSCAGANPELAKLRGKRCVIFTEPEENAYLNNSIMKELTGDKKLSTRALFGNPFNLKPIMTPIIECNSFKLQNVNDDGIPRRTIFMKFTESFVPVNEIKYKYQKKRDSTLKSEDTLNKLKGALMYILLERRKELSTKDYKIDIPSCIKEDKEEFINDNDTIHQFIEECVDVTEEKTDYITLKDIISQYKEYLEDNDEKYKKVPKNVLINKLSRYLPEFKKRHTPYVDGKRKDYTNCFIGCKFSINI